MPEHVPLIVPRGLGSEGRDIQGFLPGVAGTLDYDWTLAFALFRERISERRGEWTKPPGYKRTKLRNIVVPLIVSMPVHAGGASELAPELTPVFEFDA